MSDFNMSDLIFFEFAESCVTCKKMGVEKFATLTIIRKDELIRVCEDHIPDWCKGSAREYVEFTRNIRCLNANIENFDPRNIFIGTYYGRSERTCSICQHRAQYFGNSTLYLIIALDLCEQHGRLAMSLGCGYHNKGREPEAPWRSIRKKRQDTWNKIQLMKKFAGKKTL